MTCSCRGIIPVLLLGLITVLSLSTAFPALAEPSTLEVTGEHVATPTPDQAVLRLAVDREVRFSDHPETERQQLLQDLQTEIQEATSRVRRELLELPFLEEENIHTVDVTIGSWQERGERDYEIVGWQGQHILQVRTEELDRISVLLSRAFEAGATRTHRLEFTLTDSTRRTARNNALAGAVQNARQSAETMASAAGVELGPIQLIQVTERPSPNPYFRAAMLESEDMTAPAVHPPDTLEVRAEVLMKFSLDQVAGEE